MLVVCQKHMAKPCIHMAKSCVTLGIDSSGKTLFGMCFLPSAMSMLGKIKQTDGGMTVAATGEFAECPTGDTQPCLKYNIKLNQNKTKFTSDH